MMKKRALTKGQTLSLSLGLTTVIALSAGPMAAGCLNRPIEPVEPRTTSTVVERIKQEGVDKIDLLLAIDNSSSMADKQKTLADAVPDLVNRLVNPLCVDKNGAAQPTQPANPQDECDKANGFDREFPAILDIHIGIISSSLGGLGADQCGDNDAGHNNNDHGELVARATGGDPTGGKGFLNWAPQKGGISDSTQLASSFKDLVVGVGQVGCGYEMQLESIYRFLVDPKPYLHVTKDDPSEFSSTTVADVDQTLLDQRADFLRGDSLVAIIVLTDENDCSTRTGTLDGDPNQQAGGQFYTVLDQAGFYKAANICATNPGDKCCYSCGLPVPTDCPSGAAPECGPKPRYDTSKGEDSVNLRCWHQKQRYGFDALYPTARYVNALSLFQIDPTSADLTGSKPQANPLFMGTRSPDLVFLAGIVGVPWQTVAKTDASGNPDLKLGFQGFDDLTKNGFWDKYVGDPDTYVAPTESIMQEDFNKRPGIPAAPSNASPNGGDRSISTTAPTDIQYTCIFPLAMAVPNGPNCGAGSAPDDPLCDPAMHSTQIAAKAYPGLRELAVLHGLAGQGIPASICPANLTDPNSSDYGYRPAVATIIDRLKSKLKGTCLPRKLSPDPKTGDIPCIVLEASHSDAGQVDCTTIPGRQPVSKDHEPAVEAAKQDAQAPMAPNEWNSFCEIIQLTDNGTPPDARDQCQNNESDQVSANVNGWCYIDAESIPPQGNANLSDISQCPQNERRLVRFVNGGNIQSGATALITCSGEGAL